MKTFVVGDIHGSIAALEQACDRAGINQAQDRLIVLGDVADGWYWTPECVDFLLGFTHLVSLLGNHDAWAADWLNRGLARPEWLLQGGLATMETYVAWMEKTSTTAADRHRRFFRTLMPYFIDEKNRLFVHAGVHQHLPVRQNPIVDLTWDRSLWDRAEDIHRKKQRIVLLADPEEQIDGGSIVVPADATAEGANRIHEVFIGHTSLQTDADPYPLPQYRAGIWNLDTGAGWTGVLTVMDIDEMAVHQSDPAHILYPEDIGRR